MSDADIMAMSGIAETAMNIAGNITASTFNYEHTKELAKWQNDMNIENWKMANEYNLPVNQMKRLEAAGLNPNLMYGQGNPGNAGMVHGASAPSHNEVKNPFEGVQVVQQYLTAKRLSLENEALQSDVVSRKIHVDKEVLDYKQRVRSENILRLFAADKSNGSYSPLEPTRFGNAFSQLYLWEPKILRGSAEYQSLERMYKSGKLTQAQIDAYNANVGKANAQTDYLSHQVENQKAIDEVFKMADQYFGDFAPFFKGLFLIFSQLGKRGGVQQF